MEPPTPPLPVKIPIYYPKNNDLSICFTHTGIFANPKNVKFREKYWDKFIKSFDKKPTMFVWQFSPVRNHPVLSENIKILNKTSSRVNIIICANDKISLDYINNLEIHNLSAILCNHNAAVDRNKFTINEEIKPIWDSIYSATLRQCKRHFLSHDLDNICYLTGGWQDGKDYQKIYDDLHQNQTNMFTLVHQNIPNNRMPLFYNMSKIGLCLSKHEGAMYSSVEYLLCGLPIVSTRSFGGRDEFFTDKNCIFAEDNSNSVKDCVNQWLNNYPSLKERHAIREDTIRLQKVHAKNLKNKIKEIAEQQHMSIDIDKFYQNIYCNKLHGTTLMAAD